MQRRWWLVLMTWLGALGLVSCRPGTASTPTQPSAAEGQALVLATTTSTYDSGLLDYLLPDFERQYGVQVKVVAVGTGQALQLARDGNADVVLVHARDLEDAFMAEGYGIRREDVMYNDFVVLGPPDDPAGIKGLNSAPEAFRRIAAAQVPFVSRGDQSGTHHKELRLWEAAGITPQGDWYLEAGQGMGAVLTMADELGAYTLSDRGTYLARRTSGSGLRLKILVEGDPVLFNPYGVIVVNPERFPQRNIELAQRFVDWLIAVPTQERIAGFGVEQFGQPLFMPDSRLWREAHAGTTTP